MDEKKFAAILCAENANEYQHIMHLLDTLVVPNGYKLEVVMFSDSDNLAVMYNAALKNTDAKYKIYIKPSVKYINELLLYKILQYIPLDPGIEVLGLYGSEIPLDGNYIDAQNVYGSYYYKSNDENMKAYCGKEPVYIQDVHTIDDSFFITCTSTLWDETMNGPFLMSAYCATVRKNGKKVVVAKQSLKDKDVWVIFDKNIKNDYWRQNINAYNAFRTKFVTKYRTLYLPLVSIAIPAYNQPEFFEQALKTALQQTYANIEIIIGDDSTDGRIEKLIQPYLEKYKNIRYYHHNKPLGRNGICNMDFLIEKCNGKYINLLFQDDLIKEHKITSMMDYYMRDLNDEIGIITSSRYLINEKNKIVATMEGMITGENQVLSAKEAGTRILQLGINYIGEYSTVLLPKSVLYSIEDKKYRIGIYSNMIDSSMADVSTWLEIFRKGLKLIRIAEPLSAFRCHSEQNTHKNMVKIRVRMDWLSFYVLSWENNIFINSVENLMYYCKKFITDNPLMLNTENLTNEEWLYYNKYTQFTDYALNDMKQEFLDVAYKYIEDNRIRA